VPGEIKTTNNKQTQQTNKVCTLHAVRNTNAFQEVLPTTFWISLNADAAVLVPNDPYVELSGRLCCEQVLNQLLPAEFSPMRVETPAAKTIEVSQTGVQDLPLPVLEVCAVDVCAGDMEATLTGIQFVSSFSVIDVCAAMEVCAGDSQVSPCGFGNVSEQNHQQQPHGHVFRDVLAQNHQCQSHGHDHGNVSAAKSAAADKWTWCGGRLGTTPADATWIWCWGRFGAKS
jgi:hypothetical protein